MRSKPSFRLFTLSFVLILLSGQTALLGQAYCYDSSVITNWQGCSADYRPVCGCDGKTYRNSCISYYQYGVTTYTDGACEPLSIDLKPNPVKDLLKLTLVLREKSSAALFIFDLYGKEYYYHYLPVIDIYNLDVNSSEWPTGVYFVMLVSNGEYTLKKLLKQEAL